MYINICIFEDNLYKNLRPLTFFRPIYDCFCGCARIVDKLKSPFENVNVSLHMRAKLKPLFQKEYPYLPINQWNKGAPCLFINGRLLYSQELIETLLGLDPKHNHLLTHQGQVVAIGATVDHLAIMQDLLQGTPDNTELIQQFRQCSITKEICDISMITQPWDIISINNRALVFDANSSQMLGVNKADNHPFVSIYNEGAVYVGERTQIEDFVVIDASKGPVYIESDVHIYAHSRLEGPLFIGHHSHILGATIKQSSIGPYCKIGGEVSQSVFMPFSNKAHYGYVGHSFIGSWVNLGAGTTTSNLKSNYNTVNVEVEGHKINTGSTFLGALMGDYVKTGIGTLLNTGTIVGTGSTIFGPELHPKWIPPFKWGSASNYENMDREKFLNTTERMMKRRQCSLTKTMTDTLITLLEE